MTHSCHVHCLGWVYCAWMRLDWLPSTCPCGQKCNVTHALNCKKGGFITIRQNNIRNFEAGLLSQVVMDVENWTTNAANRRWDISGTGNATKPDIRARGVWRDGQNAFFDVLVPHGKVYLMSPVPYVVKSASPDQELFSEVTRNLSSRIWVRLMA